jgi:hypothetical protein
MSLMCPRSVVTVYAVLTDGATAGPIGMARLVHRELALAVPPLDAHLLQDTTSPVRLDIATVETNHEVIDVKQVQEQKRGLADLHDAGLPPLVGLLLSRPATSGVELVPSVASASVEEHDRSLRRAAHDFLRSTDAMGPSQVSIVVPRPLQGADVHSAYSTESMRDSEPTAEPGEPGEPGEPDPKQNRLWCLLFGVGCER